MKRILTLVFLVFSMVAFSQKVDEFGDIDYGDNKVDPDDALVWAEKMPEFPGGIDSLKKFIVTNVKYPQEAIEKNIQGTVYLRFIIAKTGKVDNVQVTRGIDPFLDNEAIRVIKMLPDFEPGIQNQKPVAVWYSVPLVFQLPEEDPLPIAEQMPIFPGGELALRQYISENITYPEEAINNNIEGSVYMKFVITKEGKVEDVSLISSPNEMLNNEAIRLIQSLPDFSPGMQDGKPVSVWYSFPVTFKIKEYKKRLKEDKKQLKKEVKTENKK